MIQSPNFNDVAQTWEKWERWLEPCYRNLDQRFLEKAEIQQGDSVLDLGCGTGHAAILEAQHVGQTGRVHALDISPEMLAVAQKRADELELNNLHFQLHDVDILPFAEQSFDSVTTRFCLMFLSAPENTLKESYRVLKKGGRFVACVWGASAKNPLPHQVLQHYTQIPAADSSVVGPFRFGTSGVLQRVLQSCGFIETIEEEVIVKEAFTDGLQYVQHLLESSATWRSTLTKLGPEPLQEATDRLIQAAEEFRVREVIEIPRCALLVSGSR